MASFIKGLSAWIALIYIYFQFMILIFNILSIV